MDLQYDTAAGVCLPHDGFKGCGDRYTVGDACNSVSDMRNYELTPEEVLQLKLCFDRINRKTKKEVSATESSDELDARSAATRYWRRRRERLRALFNARYFRLPQLAIKTPIFYNMRPYIVTQPMRQCTHQYDTKLRRLCRLDGLPPQEFQTKKCFIYHDHSWRSSSGVATAKSGKQKSSSSSHINNDSLQKFWKAMNESEL